MKKREESRIRQLLFGIRESRRQTRKLEVNMSYVSENLATNSFCRNTQPLKGQFMKLFPLAST